jgi:hypothetical protein
MLTSSQTPRAAIFLSNAITPLRTAISFKDGSIRRRLDRVLFSQIRSRTSNQRGKNVISLVKEQTVTKHLKPRVDKTENAVCSH